MSFNLLKSSGAFVIYIWLATILVGVISWIFTSRMTNPSIKSDLIMYKSVEFVIWLSKPLPVIAFIVLLIIAILITIDWLKSKSKK